MGVFDGQPVNAATTNPAFIDANADDTGYGAYTLANTGPGSGAVINNIQALMNQLRIGTGATETTPGTAYLSQQRITDGDTHELALGELDTAFHGVTGHTHTGAPGDGPPISAAGVTGNPLHGYYIQGADLFGVTGSSLDVSSQFTGAIPSTSNLLEGVVVNAPYNKCVIRQASGAFEDDSYTDASGNLVYGRLTESGGAWTLSFDILDAGIEAPYTFTTSSDVRFYYQQLFNPLQNAPVYSELAFIPSDNATADIITATSGQQGKVQLQGVASVDIGSMGTIGTMDAIVANANHTHRGVHSFAASGASANYGDLVLAGSNPVTVTDLGSGVIEVGFNGIVPINEGGTGQTTASGAFDALSPLTTKGDLLGYSTQNVRVPVGSDGFVLTADSTKTDGVDWKPAGAGSFSAPTVQTFASGGGSGTYTTPVGVLYIRVKMAGGGGGGASGQGAVGSNSGTNGGNTTFGSSLLTANGGTGAAGSTGNTDGGGGGSGTVNSPAVQIVANTGSTGSPGGFTGSVNTIAMQAIGGTGGANLLGGAGAGGGISGTSGNNGYNAIANTGGGGGGGGTGTNNSSYGGGGGGAGAYLEAIISSPSSTYAYSVGAKGTGGAATTACGAGGDGADGILIVEEYYQ